MLAVPGDGHSPAGWLLVKPAQLAYYHTMLKQAVLILGVAVCGMHGAFGDTLQLKENSSIVGKILAEKRDQVAIDIGYTVLVIPRNQISKINKTDAPAPETSTKTVATPKAAAAAEQNELALKPSFYTAPNKPAAVRSVRDLVKLLGEAVVQVRTPGGLGSGFVINEDGFLITNFHVIEGETQISVEVYHQRGTELDRKSYKQVRIMAMNKFEDLALLKIEDKDAPKFKYVLMGNSDMLAVGERVFAVGSPLGLERTVTEGILSTKTRPLAGELYLQTTTQINPGNSGGPLFNMSGEVVGVTNMKITFGEGLGFAIPIESVKFFLDHRDAFAYSNDNPSNAYHYLAPPSHTRLADQEPIE
jgi:serine protease Do